MAEKLLLDPFLKNQNLVYLWINGIKALQSLFVLYANLVKY